MEKKFLRYALIIIIFFIGLSMGISYRENNRSEQIQDELRDFENIITNPNNNYSPKYPVDVEHEDVEPIQREVKSNFFTSLAKDGENLIKKTINLVFAGTDDLFKTVFK